MGNVILGATLSLDGYINDRKGSVDALYPDLDTWRESAPGKESIQNTGAVVMGRNDIRGMSTRLFAIVRAAIVATIFVSIWVWFMPRWMASSKGAPLTPDWNAAALILMAIGGLIMLKCVWDFAWTGRGTPAPFDPPRRLVITGLYRYVRNPMYVGMGVFLVGEALFLPAVMNAMLLTVVALLSGMNIFGGPVDVTTALSYTGTGTIEVTAPTGLAANYTLINFNSTTAILGHFVLASGQDPAYALVQGLIAMRKEHPALRRGWTDDVYVASKRAAGIVQQGAQASRVLDKDGKVLLDEPDDGTGARPEAPRGALRRILLDLRSQLAADAPAAPVQAAVQDHSAADAGPHGDHQHVAAAPARAETIFGPCRCVGVVLDHHRQPVFTGEVFPDAGVAKAEVGGEEDPP